MGRINKYESHVKPFLNDIAEWYGTMTERQIAKRLGISMASFESYKKEHKELTDTLRKGKVELVRELKDTLKKKARGFVYVEKKTVIRTDEEGRISTIVEEYEKNALPDTGAIHLLLKNLDEDWRNDDAVTVAIKKQKVELEKEKAEAENW